MQQIVFLDIETTGLNYNNNQILQLSYIISNKNAKIIDAKNFYVDVDVEIEEGATNVHAITKEKIKILSQGKKFKDIAAEVFWDLTNSKIICHNTNFDLSFIEKEFSRLNKTLKTKGSFCTMQYYTDILKIRNDYGYKWPKLTEVVDFLDLDKNELLKTAKEIFNTDDNIELHDARLDVYYTYVIYHKMIIKSLNLYKEIQKNITENNIGELLKLDINHKILNIDELRLFIKDLDSYKEISNYWYNIESAIGKLKIIKTLMENSHLDNFPNDDIENEKIREKIRNGLIDDTITLIDDDDIPF